MAPTVRAGDSPPLGYAVETGQFWDGDRSGTGVPPVSVRAIRLILWREAILMLSADLNPSA